MWLLGAAFELAGFAAHASALCLGSFAAVQLILGGSLVVSVAVNGRFARRPLGRRAWSAVPAVVVGVGAATALLGVGGHATDRLGPAALVSGLVMAPVAAAALLARGPRRALLLLVGGLVSMLITQTAYQVDEPLTTLPLIATVMPLATLAVGLTVLGESAHLSGARCLAAVGVALLAVAGLAVLARSAPQVRVLEVPDDLAGDPVERLDLCRC